MACFSNGSEGMVLDDQCFKCVLGEKSCPILFVQMSYNYDAVGNKIATEILNYLVNEDGECQMFNNFKEIFGVENELNC